MQESVRAAAETVWRALEDSISCILRALALGDRWSPAVELTLRPLRKAVARQLDQYENYT